MSDITSGTIGQAGPEASPLANDATHGASPLLLAAALALVTLLVYWPVVNWSFVDFDDADYVSANPHVLSGLSVANLQWAFTTDHAGNWHPVTWISHMLDAQLFGKGPRGPHFTNLLLHVLNTVLLFFVGLRMTGARWRSAMVAALFALHPFHVESVAWISERKDVLSAFFFFLTLSFYARYCQHRDSNGRPASWKKNYALALIFFALGLLSKPMLVTMPFLLLLLDYWPLQRVKRFPLDAEGRAPSETSAVAQPQSLSRLLLEKAPFFALAVASSIITFLVQRGGGAVQTLVDLSPAFRFENSLIAYTRYLGKTFWPVRLAVPYPLPLSWPIPTVLFAIVLLAALTVAVLVARHRRPFLFVGWFWFVGMLIPVIGLVQVGEQSMADRYTYLPLVGLFIAGCWWFPCLLRCVQAPSWAPATMAAVLLIPCVVRTRQQMGYWRNSETLFTHSVSATYKNWLAYFNLGHYYDDQGKLDLAIANYRKTVQLQPNYPSAWNNLGCALAAQRKMPEALQCFQTALRLKPDFQDARENVALALSGTAPRPLSPAKRPPGVSVLPSNAPDELNRSADTLAQRGQFEQALVEYRKSLAIQTNQPAVHYSVANALAHLRRNDESIPEYRIALSQNPAMARAHHDLGVALGKQGALDAALVELKEAVRLEPEEAIMQSTLGKALAARGNFDDALPHLQKATQLQPENPVTHFLLGNVLAAQKKKDLAAREFQEALRLKPDFAQAQQALEALGK